MHAYVCTYACIPVSILLYMYINYNTYICIKKYTYIYIYKETLLEPSSSVIFYILCFFIELLIH